MKVGIIGNGFVGQATNILKCDDISVLMYDIIPEKCVPEGLTLDTMVVECEFIFISVPTPMNEDSSCDLSIVCSVVKNVSDAINRSCGENQNKPFVVMRSTVPIGTSDSLGCYFMPEFLTEKNWRQDFRECKKWFFGIPASVSVHGHQELFKQRIKHLFHLAKYNNCILNTNIEFMSNKEAEMIKYFRNTFLAVKVSYCNEMEEFCTCNGINYENVRLHATQDSRIGPSHSQVPGHDSRRGFGGTCFPKDTNSLLFQMKSVGMESHILQSAVYRNENIDRSEKDWCQDIGRAVSKKPEKK